MIKINKNNIDEELLKEVRILAYEDGYENPCPYQLDPICTLLLIKEHIRRKYKVNIENDHGERGSLNHKTKEYFTCKMSKRIKDLKNPRRKRNRDIAFATYDTYEEALLGSIYRFFKTAKNLYDENI